MYATVTGTSETRPRHHAYAYVMYLNLNNVNRKTRVLYPVYNEPGCETGRNLALGMYKYIISQVQAIQFKLPN